jgi:hypothetical protein
MAESRLEWAGEEAALAPVRTNPRPADSPRALPDERSAGWATFRWAALAAVAGIASALPLWSSELLPFQDAPQHVATVRVLADYANPVLGFARWFEIDLRRLEYLGFYLPAAAIAKLVGAQAACRVVLTLVALALPAAAWMFLAAFDRDRRLAVFAPALFHTATLYLGFFNFVESVPALLVVVALIERELREPRRARALILAAAGPVLLWLHPSALAMALGAGVFLAITRGESWRRSARALAPFLPALVLLAVWAFGALAHRDGVEAVAHTTANWLGPKRQLLELLRFGNVLKGHADELCVAALVLLWLAATLVPGRHQKGERSWRLPLLAAVTFAVYMVTPFDIGFMGYIHLRPVPLLVMAVVASPRLAPGRLTGALLAAAVAVQVAYAAKLSSVYRAFDSEAQVSELHQVLRAAAPGQRLLALVYDQKSALVAGRSFLHFAAYYELDRGGRARMNFAEYPWTPVRYRRGNEPDPLPRYWEAHPAWYDANEEGADADYVLVRGAGPGPGSRFRLQAEAGEWALYAATPSRAAAR